MTSGGPAGSAPETRTMAATEAAIAAAAAALRGGELVAFPTEPVYGLGADARSGAAVARIYAAKARPRFNPLIAHVASLDAALRQGVFPPDAIRLAERCWPGPLTLVVPASATCTVSLLARAGLDTVALRVPAHPVARALLAEADMPVAAPSANRSGRISPTTAAHVLAELAGLVPLILDGGACAVGVESTIVACREGAVTLLRPGGVSREELEALLGRDLEAHRPATTRPSAPGQFASHYAPHAAVRLDARRVEAGESVLDFGAQLAPPLLGQAYRDLSPAADLGEAAAGLFAALRALDTPGAARIAVAPIPHSGLGAAINDRLRRAAAPRDAST